MKIEISIYNNDLLIKDMYMYRPTFELKHVDRNINVDQFKTIRNCNLLSCCISNDRFCEVKILNLNISYIVNRLR